MLRLPRQVQSEAAPAWSAARSATVDVQISAIKLRRRNSILTTVSLAAALAALTLQLQGAAPADRPARVSSSADAARGGAHAFGHAAASTTSAAGLPIFPPQIVDPYDDNPSRLRRAGLLRGALPLPSENRIAGGCTFDIECDDSNPCTADTCAIDIPSGASGTCTNIQLPPGAPGECGDGLFCNGIEFCDSSGVCVDGPDATCCAGDVNEYCTENMGACDDASSSPGRRCATDADCGGGKCNHCRLVCEIDGNCDDGLACNGAETCTGGECFPGVPPCGAGALCSEMQCVGQSPARACLADQDCNPGIQCSNSLGPLCFLGRCCSNADEPACTGRRLDHPAGPTCQSTGGKFFPGDAGFETGAPNTCGGANPREPGTQFGCPKYSSGIEQLTVENPPTYPVAAGPMSASAATVNMPGGPGAALNRLGDDYSLSNDAYIRLTAMRFVGFMSVPDAIFFEFWDAEGNFIEEVMFRPSTGVGINMLILENPIVIPPSGRVTAITKRDFGLNAKFIWMSATGATTGTNDVDTLFANDDPDAANFMSPNPGVLAFELLGGKVAAPLGGCCRPDGSCSDEVEWVCNQLSGRFQDVGSVCPNAACDAGACCNAGDGSCTLTAAESCNTPDEFLGLGSSCDPNCCFQPAADTDCSDGICYTGADNCADAFVHVIPELPCADCGPGGTPSDHFTVTITGDNSFASATETNPDSCWGVADDVNSDQGWWEAFELTGSCTRIRFDFCCTTPVRYGDWAFVTDSCDCDHYINGNVIDPFTEPFPLDHRGAPYCDEENFWSVMGVMRQGTYYLPVNSTLEDDLGQYQLHIVAEACPKAACCLADGSCIEDVDLYQCENQGGTYQGQPNKYPPAETCTASLCETGSCCTGPGMCADEILGVLMDKDDCDGMQGEFTPGIRCEGGTCAVNANLSCNSPADCPSGQCNGTSFSLAQPSPCPICSLEGSSTCQLYDNPSGLNYSIADLSVGSGQLVADDFVATPTLTTIDQVCVWGIYVTTDPDAVQEDCGESRLADNFRVRILGSTEAGLPDTGNVIGSTSATAERALLPNQNSLTVWSPPVETYAFQLTLDTPVAGLVPGQTYWLEVANELSPLDECAFWLVELSNNSPQGNNFSAAGSDAGGYPLGSEREVDFAFCLSGAFDPPSAPVRPCCTCSGQCVSTELAACTDMLGQFAMDAVNNGIPLSCGTEYQCPSSTVGSPNDECSSSLDVGVGVHPVSILCATTDQSLNPVLTEYGSVETNFDIWFEFTAPQDCTFVASMCPLPDVFDSVIAVYSNGTGTCTCPTQPAATEPTFLEANDEGCGLNLSAGWTSIVEVPAQAGQCFLIRIGNWAPGNTRGAGVVDISCGPPICGDNAAQAANGEECDGVDDAACPGLCRPPGDAQECTCGPPPECGNNVREGDETCDGTDSAQCPGFCPPPGFPGECMCMSECGDGVRVGVEECDGPSDTSCGGVAGRCDFDCTCPPVACGNNFADPGEECDGTDDAYCPGDCRTPGDAAGECTCRCPVIVDPFCMPLPEIPQVTKPRFFTLAVSDGCDGTDYGIRVELTSLHHPSSPPPGTPDFTALEGDFRYVNSFAGGVTTCVDSATFSTNYRCGQLGCQPEYRDWFATLSNATNPVSPAGLIHVTGDAVVPSSSYSVSMIAAFCGASPAADTCAFASTALSVSTARWGDVGGSGGGVPDGMANVIDIGTVVDCVKGVPTGLPEYRCWMKNPANPATNPINVIDIGLTVDAVKGFPYPYAIAACP